MSSSVVFKPVIDRQSTNSKKAFQIKGSGFTIPVFHVLVADMDLLTAQLVKQVSQAAGFFQNAPLVIDLNAIEESDSLNLAQLVHFLRSQGVIPVGLSGGNEQQKSIANGMELAILTASGRRKVRKPELELEPEPTTEPEPDESSVEDTAAPQGEIKKDEEQGVKHEPVEIIEKPVRSGQSIIASRGDLIVAASVSSGAEIKAAGNIHVYGVLRGRALAGIEGDKNVSIFCQSLEADLVSIAGKYQVSEAFPTGFRSKAVRIRLYGGELDFTFLN